MITKEIDRKQMNELFNFDTLVKAFDLYLDIDDHQAATLVDREHVPLRDMRKICRSIDEIADEIVSRVRHKIQTRVSEHERAVRKSQSLLPLLGK